MHVTSLSPSTSRAEVEFRTRARLQALTFNIAESRYTAMERGENAAALRRCGDDAQSAVVAESPPFSPSTRLVAAESRRSRSCRAPQRRRGTSVGVESHTRQHCTLARVVDVHPGKEGFTRVVIVCNANTILPRPLPKLILLLPSASEKL